MADGQRQDNDKQEQQRVYSGQDQSLLSSFNHAISGFMHSFRMERNMRYHVVIAVCVIIAALLVRVTRFELIAIITVIGFVFFAELANTAMEAIVDFLVEKKYSDLAKIAKDVSAGAVLIAAGTSIAVGFLVFFQKFSEIANRSMFAPQERTGNLPAYLTFAALLLVFVGVIVIKSRFLKKGGTYVQGGMPSGHTAFAFSLFTAIAFVSGDAVATVFAAIMALIVAESRMETKVHSFAEVVMGAFLGVVITVIVFEISNLFLY
ncbi:MAG TPA: diacylglycerol kinase [Clostridiales bacterium]|nr:diacylglycerol kinase [Clostridiales bacterium]